MIHGEEPTKGGLGCGATWKRIEVDGDLE